MRNATTNWKICNENFLQIWSSEHFWQLLCKLRLTSLSDANQIGHMSKYNIKSIISNEQHVSQIQSTQLKEREPFYLCNFWFNYIQRLKRQSVILQHGLTEIRVNLLIQKYFLMNHCPSICFYLTFTKVVIEVCCMSLPGDQAVSILRKEHNGDEAEL